MDRNVWFHDNSFVKKCTCHPGCVSKHQTVHQQRHLFACLFLPTLQGNKNITRSSRFGCAELTAGNNRGKDISHAPAPNVLFYQEDFTTTVEHKGRCLPMPRMVKKARSLLLQESITPIQLAQPFLRTSFSKSVDGRSKCFNDWRVVAGLRLGPYSPGKEKSVCQRGAVGRERIFLMGG